MAFFNPSRVLWVISPSIVAGTTITHAAEGRLGASTTSPVEGFNHSMNSVWLNEYLKFRIHLDNCPFPPCEPLLRASDK